MNHQERKVLAAKYEITILDIDENPEYGVFKQNDPNNFVNKSYLIGKHEIILGHYDDNDMKDFAFMHEIGHTTMFQKDLSNKTLFEIEDEVWKFVFHLAEINNITISPAVEAYVVSTLNSCKIEADV